MGTLVKARRALWSARRNRNRSTAAVALGMPLVLTVTSEVLPYPIDAAGGVAAIGRAVALDLFGDDHAKQSEKRLTGKRRKRRRSRSGTLPLPRRLLSRHKVSAPHHDYPAWDAAVPMRTAVYAVKGGRIVAVTNGGACGKGAILRGRDGFTYTYCHGSKVIARRGRRVAAGQLIMRSGNSGHSTGPHLHLQMRNPRGRLVCPQPVLRSLFANKPIPRKATSRGCHYSSGHHHHKRTKSKARNDKRRASRNSEPRASDGRRDGAGERDEDSDPAEGSWRREGAGDREQNVARAEGSPRRGGRGDAVGRRRHRGPRTPSRAEQAGARRRSSPQVQRREREAGGGGRTPVASAPEALPVWINRIPRDVVPAGRDPSSGWRAFA